MFVGATGVSTSSFCGRYINGVLDKPSAVNISETANTILRELLMWAFLYFKLLSLLYYGILICYA